MFRLNRNKQKTNRNSLIGSIFCYFYRKFKVFPVFFQFFRFCFWFVSVVLLLYQNRGFQCFDWTETNRIPTQTFCKRVYLGIFQKIWGCFGLFRSVTKQFCLFQLFPYRFETPKQTEIFCFWFHETNQKQILFRFVLFRTKIYFCLFLGHPSPTLTMFPIQQ